MSSAIARTDSLGKLGKIMGYMALVFLFTGVVAAVYALFVVKFFPPAQGVYLQLAQTESPSPPTLSSQIVAIFSVPDFIHLLSHKNMLALIVFSLLVGVATANANETGKKFAVFLQAGEAVFLRCFFFNYVLRADWFFCLFCGFSE